MKSKICSKCEKPVEKYGNVFKKLCIWCNRDRLNENKPKKYSSIKPKFREPTGEREVHLIIWSERPHYCEHCGDYLGEYPDPWFFSHIKPKSTHPELRNEKSNYNLFCKLCHDAFGSRGADAFNARKDINRK